MIRVACPHCERRFRTKLEAMGRTAICTGCHESFKIGESRPKFEWKDTDLSEASWIGVEPPKEKEELKHCIMCQAPMTPGTISCPACGANQVTGIVHRPRPTVAAGKSPVWSIIPTRAILLLGTVVLVGAAVFWGVRSLSESVTETSEQLVYQRIVNQAAKHLRDGGDESSFAERFSGQVHDGNLVAFLTRLSATDGDERQATIRLIACGNVTQLEPIVSLARSSGEDNHTQREDDSDRETAREVLETIGLRRLVALSNHESSDRDPSNQDSKSQDSSSQDALAVRQSAAEALCLLSELACDDEVMGTLTEPTSSAEKIDTLNQLCRPWPRATGRFSVVMGETEARFDAQVEQIGRRFFLQIRSTVFQSSPVGKRAFDIPIEKWCAATGIAVDPSVVRTIMSGLVTLESPYGEGWEGFVRVTAKAPLTKMPGFLPIGPLEMGETVEAAIHLE